MLRAWTRLDSCRQIAPLTLPVDGGKASVTTVFEGPIPWPAIEHWAASQGLSVAATELLADVIAILDHDHAEQQADRLRSNT